MLKESVRRADNIVSSLLNFSKATALNLQPEDINSIVTSSLALVKNQYKFEHIKIIEELASGMPKVLADKARIEQVFVNILLNAIQAMPGGGNIVIRSYCKPLAQVGNGVGRRNGDSFKIGEQAAIVEFEDSGSGISEVSMKKIFDPFFTTKGPGGGTGLGLPVSRNILFMHKGLLYAESRAGKGTKMTVVLKIADNEEL
ncbi:MAG: ATP-binding protein [Candidatus Omnitrophica bacterium]|nr:ATP-binding protein [Candidatus Omnitrophota bacterium]